jgi:pimeloyl-ACP methyl ester carboxylesterase
MTWEEMAKDQSALLDTLGVVGPVVVGGASMGAGSALWLATTQPQRTMALIMVRLHLDVRFGVACSPRALVAAGAALG